MLAVATDLWTAFFMRTVDIGMAEPDNSREEDRRPEGKGVPLKFVFPDSQPATFSNFATVQNEGHEIYLSFFEIRQPILIGSDDERKQQLEKIDSIDANCVARIVMSTARIPALVEALSGQVAKAESRIDDQSKPVPEERPSQ